MKIIRDIFDTIFSVNTVLTLVFVALFCTIIFVFDKEIKRTQKIEAANQICYNQGMIMVQTDGGYKCVALESLVGVKLP